jgi:hypothetical protein
MDVTGTQVIVISVSSAIIGHKAAAALQRDGAQKGMNGGMSKL